MTSPRVGWRVLSQNGGIDLLVPVGPTGPYWPSTFVNGFVVVISACPGTPIAWARSRCEHCGTALAARDLVPVASWLAARGRCRHCGEKLGGFYPAVEAGAVIIALVSLSLHRGAAAWLDFLLGCWLMALGWIDLRRWVLPDLLTLPLILLGLLAAWLTAPATLLDRALGAAAGYLGLYAIAAIFRKVRGIEGIGGGDMKLLAAAGAWVGLTALPSVLLEGAGTALAAAAAPRWRARLGAPPLWLFGLATWMVWLLGPDLSGAPDGLAPPRPGHSGASVARTGALRQEIANRYARARSRSQAQPEDVRQRMPTAVNFGWMMFDAMSSGVGCPSRPGHRVHRRGWSARLATSRAFARRSGDGDDTLAGAVLTLSPQQARSPLPPRRLRRSLRCAPAEIR